MIEGMLGCDPGLVRLSHAVARTAHVARRDVAHLYDTAWVVIL
jgi:hypothetical protein